MFARTERMKKGKHRVLYLYMPKPVRLLTDASLVALIFIKRLLLL